MTAYGWISSLNFNKTFSWRIWQWVGCTSSPGGQGWSCLKCWTSLWLAAAAPQQNRVLCRSDTSSAGPGRHNGATTLHVLLMTDEPVIFGSSSGSKEKSRQGSWGRHDHLIAARIYFTSLDTQVHQQGSSSSAKVERFTALRFSRLPRRVGAFGLAVRHIHTHTSPCSWISLYSTPSKTSPPPPAPTEATLPGHAEHTEAGSDRAGSLPRAFRVWRGLWQTHSVRLDSHHPQNSSLLFLKQEDMDHKGHKNAVIGEKRPFLSGVGELVHSWSWSERSWEYKRRMEPKLEEYKMTEVWKGVRNLTGYSGQLPSICIPAVFWGTKDPSKEQFQHPSWSLSTPETSDRSLVYTTTECGLHQWGEGGEEQGYGGELHAMVQREEPPAFDKRDFILTREPRRAATFQVVIKEMVWGHKHHEVSRADWKANIDRVYEEKVELIGHLEETQDHGCVQQTASLPGPWPSLMFAHGVTVRGRGLPSCRRWWRRPARS